MKHGGWLAATSLALTALCTVPAAAGQVRSKPAADPAALTNADVVKMVKAGLGELVVVAAIRGAAKTAFSVTADDLVRLKQAGVSDTVLAVMLSPAAAAVASQPAAPAPAPAAPAPDPNDPLAPHDAGIYIDAGEGSPKLVGLEPAVFSQGKTGGMFTSAMTMGLKKMKWRAVVRSAHAPLRTRKTAPVFYFYFESRSSGLGNSGGFAGWVGGATSPNEFVLARMQTKDNGRELVVGEMGAFGGSSGARSEDTVEMRIEKLAPGAYRVSPATPLGPGEYCFFHGGGGNVAMGAGTAAGKLFDFGVEG